MLQIVKQKVVDVLSIQHAAFLHEVRGDESISNTYNVSDRRTLFMKQARSTASLIRFEVSAKNDKDPERQQTLMQHRSLLGHKIACIVDISGIAVSCLSTR
jgi:hypothetical protein